MAKPNIEDFGGSNDYKKDHILGFNRGFNSFKDTSHYDPRVRNDALAKREQYFCKLYQHYDALQKKLGLASFVTLNLSGIAGVYSFCSTNEQVKSNMVPYVVGGLILNMVTSTFANDARKERDIARNLTEASRSEKGFAEKIDSLHEHYAKIIKNKKGQ